MSTRDILIEALRDGIRWQMQRADQHAYLPPAPVPVAPERVAAITQARIYRTLLRTRYGIGDSADDTDS